MADPGLEGVESCTLGMGIIERLGGRGGYEDRPPAETPLVADIENAGEYERFFSDT